MAVIFLSLNLENFLGFNLTDLKSSFLNEIIVFKMCFLIMRDFQDLAIILLQNRLKDYGSHKLVLIGFCSQHGCSTQIITIRLVSKFIMAYFETIFLWVIAITHMSIVDTAMYYLLLLNNPCRKYLYFIMLIKLK